LVPQHGRVRVYRRGDADGFGSAECRNAEAGDAERREQDFC
jgi:hypothetical protein